MRLPAILLSLSILLFACSEQQSAVKNSEPPTLSKLTSDMIFSGDIVKNFKVANDSVASQANQLFLRGVDEFRNKKNPKGAVDLFVQSICLNPLAQSYYEMGNAAMSAKELNQALDAYQMAEKLGYEPFSKILYNYACIYSLKKEDEKSAYFLEASLQAGYSNIAQIRRDADLKYLREDAEMNWLFEQAIKEGMKGMSNPEQLFWLQFQKTFAKVKDNFFIDGMTQQFKEKDHISYDYESYISEMRLSKYSRDVEAIFYSVAQINTGTDVVALVYAEADAFSEHPFYIYRLVTFTNTGKIIDKRVIAGREELEQLRKAKFAKGGKVTVSTYDLTYENDVSSAGYEDNPIASKKLTDTQEYVISADGKIVGQDVAATN